MTTPTVPFRITTIHAVHQLMGLPKPAHPLVSVLTIQPMAEVPAGLPNLVVTDLYIIALKKGFNAQVRIKYGQQAYDFDEGLLSFIAPGQVFGLELEKYKDLEKSGWMLLVHPDFLQNTALGKKIKQYAYFDYAVNEALFLSEKEEGTMTQLIRNIEQEYHSAIDKFSQHIIVALLESLLNYADRFYQRQFITRGIANHQLLDRLEALLEAGFGPEAIATQGLPTVGSVAERLHMSADYLSSLLKALTGLNTQQHIHQKLLEKAKEKLSATELSVSEIAYQLGFEHPQSFSKLFKRKTSFSPLAFRQSFN